MSQRYQTFAISFSILYRICQVKAKPPTSRKCAVFVFVMVIDLEEILRMTNLAGKHTLINRFLTVGKINEVAFPFVALIMEFSAVAVTEHKLLSTLLVKWKEQ